MTVPLPLEAGGTGVGGSADQFHFLYQALTGDGEITAHVISVVQTNTLAKAGVMIRESLTAGSRHAAMPSSAGRGYAFQRRPAETAGATLQTTGSWFSPPGWVSLVRTGDLFEAYQSLNGTAWVRIGSDTVPMGATVYVGLAATSQNAISATTVRIDGLSVVWEPTTNEPPASVHHQSDGTVRESTAPGPVT